MDAGAFEIEAAGGVVTAAGNSCEVVLVHRPKYDDWSFPKGKLDPGESFAAAALREVEEETGLGCRLRRELPSVEYRDARGRAKRVRYWLMEPVSGAIEERRPDREVDEIRWVDARRAEELLSYERDRELLAAALRILGRDGA